MADIFVFTVMKVLLQFKNISHFEDISALSHANNFEIIHTCASIQNTNAYEVLSDSHKYFHLAAIFVLSHL